MNMMIHPSKIYNQKKNKPKNQDKIHRKRVINLETFEYVHPEKPFHVSEKMHAICREYFENTSTWQQLRFMILEYPRGVSTLVSLLGRKYKNNNILRISRMNSHQISKIRDIKELLRKKLDGKFHNFMKNCIGISRETNWYDIGQIELERCYNVVKSEDLKKFLKKYDRETKIYYKKKNKESCNKFTIEDDEMDINDYKPKIKAKKKKKKNKKKRRRSGSIVRKKRKRTPSESEYEKKPKKIKRHSSVISVRDKMTNGIKININQNKFSRSEVRINIINQRQKSGENVKMIRVKKTRFVRKNPSNRFKFKYDEQLVIPDYLTWGVSNDNTIEVLRMKDYFIEIKSHVRNGRYRTRKNNSKFEPCMVDCIDLLDNLFPRITKDVIRDLISEQQSRILICRNTCDNEIIGCLIFKVHIALCVEILLMGVRKNIQAKGVGSFLLDGVKKMVPRYTNSVFVKSDILCPKFYVKNGFSYFVRIPMYLIKKDIFYTTESIEMECRREDEGFNFRIYC